MMEKPWHEGQMAKSDGLLVARRPPPVALRSIARLKTDFRRRRKGKGKKLVPSIQSPKSAGGKHANESSLQIISPIRSPLRSAVTRSPIKPCNNMMPDAPNSARGANKTGEAGCNKGWLGRFRKSMQTKIVRWQRRHSVAGDFQDLRKLVHLSEHRRSSLKEERLASRGRTPDLGDLPDLPEFLLATEDVDALLDTHHQEREECEAELRAWGLSPTVSSIPEEIDLSLERSDSKNSVNSNIDVEEMHIDFEDSEASAESVEIKLEGACREAAASAIPFPVGHPTNLQTRKLRPGSSNSSAEKRPITTQGTNAVERTRIPYSRAAIERTHSA